jgi:hypothetical protein
MAELKRIGSFQSFSEMRAQKQAAKLAEEQASKRDALKSKFAAIVDELDIDDVNLETVEEGNAFIFAASKAKQEGKDEFEFNGKKYKVTLKADTGLKESEEVIEESQETEEVSEAKFVKDFDKAVLDATTEDEVLKVYPNAEFFIGKMTHFFGELEPNLFFKAYYTKGSDFEIALIYSEKGNRNVDLWKSKTHYESKESVEETEEVSEAIVVTGKRDAKKVMNTYIKFFEKYPALGRNAMGVPADHHIGAVKALYEEAMIDANFSREVPATKNVMKGRLFPIDIKVADLNNAAIKVSAGKLMDICAQNGSIISGAAKWSGLAIVEGTAMYLDSIGKTKEAEQLMAKFNATFESVELMEAKVAQAMEEGNAFSTARLKAIEAGKDEFEFNGETYKVTKKDAEDEKLADELANESEINGENTNPEGYPSPAGDSDDVEETAAAEEVEVMEAEETDLVTEGEKEEQAAMEIYTDVAGPDGKYSEDELAKADMDLYMEIVTAAGHKGSKAKKIADEFRKIATLESIELEEILDEASGDFAGWVAFDHKGNRIEISKDEATSIFGAKKLAIAKLKVPKSKESMVAIAPAVEESATNEAEVKSAEDFAEYAMVVLQKAFGEDFDEAKAQEVVDGLVSKYGEDYGAMVGALQSSLGESVVTEAKYDKKKLLKAIENSDDAMILVKGKEYIIYNPDNGNDDNAAMWGDKTIMALDQDGEEHEFKYSDIERFSESVEVTEKKSDGTISDDEDERREALMAEVESAMDQLLAKIKADADDIGGSFRSPGIMYDAKKIMDTKLKRFK